MHRRVYTLATTTGPTEPTDRRSRRSVALRLLQERKVFLARPIDARLAHRLMAQLMFLEAENPTAPIEMYITSPGGEIDSGFAIYDTMNTIRCQVTTISAGVTASMATLILAGGTKGHRFSYPNSRILIHQPLGGVRGPATDVEIAAREILKLKDRTNQILAAHTGQPLKRIEKDTNRDFWMSAAEAKEYGLIDAITVAAQKV